VSNDRRVHPTQKPVALIEYLIKTYTNENEIVLDFTMGSGTTGVACKNLNRDFIGIEMDTDYFEIAKQRIQSVSPLTDFFEKD
jgi:site-specific DNA-methyltransferase (adenine-specific)